MTEETKNDVAIADKKTGRSPKVEIIAKTESIPESFDYVKKGIYYVCPACNEPIQTDLNGVKLCPIKNKTCPRNGD